MKYYFAGADNSNSLSLLKQENVKRILVSYYSLTKKHIPEYANFETFLDSGAFSALSQNDPVDIDQYIQFLKDHKDNFKVYANLDEIGSAEGTLKNQLYMEEHGLQPLPCFHYGEDFKFLIDYAEKYDYFAIGGLVPYAKDFPKITEFLDKVFHTLEPYFKRAKPLKLHGFGMGGPRVLTRYPFYSADSTSWLSGGTFGTMVIWDPQKYRFVDQFHYSDKTKMLNNNVNIKALDDYKERQICNIREYQKMEVDITKLWAVRGIKWED